MAGEFLWRPVCQGPVSTTLIVFASPCIDDLLRFGQCLESVRVKTLCAEGPIERFHKGVDGRLTGPREVDLELRCDRPTDPVPSL